MHKMTNLKVIFGRRAPVSKGKILKMMKDGAEFRAIFIYIKYE